MTTIQICTPALPSSSRALSPSVAVPSVSVPSVSGTGTWRDRVVGTGVSRVGAAVMTRHLRADNHNSIVATAAAAEAGIALVDDDFYAAKQAAPPRGILR